ncbi:MAG: cupredoxin domain-containing protein, partial [Thermomicrobiaceae bacterium]|nr:cupredoxin domain-containing protein [Thermomicrobiaceae bacterium]
MRSQAISRRSVVGLVVALGLVAALSLLVGPLGAGAAQSVTLDETEFKITPNTLTATVGEPVTFTVTNSGKLQHNITVELESRGIEQTLFDANLQPGETKTATYTFSQAGEWEMYCPVGQHRQAGMTGTIMVQAAASGSTAGGTSQLSPATGHQGARA